MSVLIINFFFVSFLLIFYKATEKNKGFSRWILFIIFIQLLYIKTFADIDSLPDLISYQNHFEYVQRMSFNELFHEELEFGHFLLAKFCNMISGSFRFFLFVYSLLFLSIYFKWIKKNSTNIALSILLFLLMVYNGSLYVLRQNLAISIILLTYPAIINRKLIIFVLLVCMAMTIHITAIVFLPLYFMYHIKKWYTMTGLVVVFSCIMLWLTRNPVVLMALMGENDKYVAALGNGDMASKMTPAIINMFFVITYFMVIGKKSLLMGYNRLFSCLLILSSLILLIGAGLPLAERLASYYKVGLILIIPYTAVNMKDKYLRLVFISFVLIFEFYLAFFSGSASDYLNVKIASPF